MPLVSHPIKSHCQLDEILSCFIENIYFFLKGLSVKPKKQEPKEAIDVEDRFAYLSDEESDTIDEDDEEWSPSKEYKDVHNKPLSTDF